MLSQVTCEQVIESGEVITFVQVTKNNRITLGPYWQLTLIITTLLRILGKKTYMQTGGAKIWCVSVLAGGTVGENILS